KYIQNIVYPVTKQGITSVYAVGEEAVHRIWNRQVPGQHGDGRMSFAIKNQNGATLVELETDNLLHINLQDHNLQYADLMGAVLFNADLSHADLKESDLRGANLSQA